MATVRLSDFVRVRKQAIVDEWARTVTAHFSLPPLGKPLLVDDLPDFLDDLALCLTLPMERGQHYEGARKHGRQRLYLGIRIDQLVEEFSLVGEVIVRLATAEGWTPSGEEVPTLLCVLGSGAAQAAGEYAALRDAQIEDQAAEHFSFMAHEIRTPLHTARLASTLLQASAGDAEETWRRLDQAHLRLTELVDNSILSARLYGRPRLRIQDVDLRALAQEVADELRPQFENRQLVLETALEAVSVRVDRKLVASALINLLGNAIKFTRPGGRIFFRLAATAQLVRLEVEDQCGGMPEDLPGKLFQPFVQGAKDRSGFGIGLMIVEQTATAHGGSVSVHNLPGQGCCFRLELPRVYSED